MSSLRDERQPRAGRARRQPIVLSGTAGLALQDARTGLAEQASVGVEGARRGGSSRHRF
jgi:hypothetical protein